MFKHIFSEYNSISFPNYPNVVNILFYITNYSKLWKNKVSLNADIEDLSFTITTYVCMI